jgi:hypothetical protein
MRAKLRGPDRGDIATNAGADHQDIELSLFVRHCPLLYVTSVTLISIARPAARRRVIVAIYSGGPRLIARPPPHSIRRRAALS